ncbi:MAG: biotin/lipoyl-containing protein [Bacillota bacterium]
MKKYRVIVNGEVFEVVIEEQGGDSKPDKPESRPAAAAPAQAEREKAAAPAPKRTAAPGENQITAPMPGVILDVKVDVGSEVKSGTVMFILEAMKMENEIQSPFEGRVKSLEVTKGASVNTGDVLAVIE